MATRAKRLIKLLKILIKADHLYTDEQIRDMKSQLRVIEEELAEAKKSKGFGNWADSSGKVVAQTKDDKLVMTKKAKEPSEKKSKKKKAKDTGDVGGPAHPNVPKKDSKKKDVKKKDVKKKTTKLK